MKSQFILLLSLTLSSSLVIGSDITRATGLRHTEVANTTVWVLPQLFNLDAANTSSIQVTNHSTTDTASLTIALRDQGGGAAVEQISAQLAPRATRNFPLNIVPLGYVGPAVVVCSRPCLVLGTWEFDLGGTKQFRVGIPALSARFRDNQWATATFDSSGNFALAVFNDSGGANACTQRYFNEFGDPVGTENFELPGVGQRAAFANVPTGFIGRAEISCASDVWVVTVAQSPLNGFPTYVRASPTTVP